MENGCDGQKKIYRLLVNTKNQYVFDENKSRNYYYYY